MIIYNYVAEEIVKVTRHDCSLRIEVVWTHSEGRVTVVKNLN